MFEITFSNLIILFSFASSVFYFGFLIWIANGIENGKKGLKSAKQQQINRFISIITVFRNEEKNLKNLIDSILSLEYPREDFEIIFVDDNSSDNSVEVIHKKCSDLQYTIIENDKKLMQSFKKVAITKAVLQAKGEIIAITDADSILPAEWLKIANESFSEKVDFISGLVTFDSDRNDFFSQAQKLEFAGLILTGGGLIGNNFPIICSGANIFFRQSAFQQVDGYSGNLHLTSGDDEFLMQKIAKLRDGNILFNWAENSVVRTNQNNNLSEFMQQRKRWASKGLFYNSKIVLLLFGLFLFYFSLFVLGISAFFVKSNAIAFLLIFSFKMIFEYNVLLHGKNLLFDSKTLNKLVFVEFLQIPYIIFASISGTFGNFIWKERKLKR